MSFLFADETLFFRILPRDITQLLMQFVRKRPLEDSNARECARIVPVESEDTCNKFTLCDEHDNDIAVTMRHITYFSGNRLRWCTSVLWPIAHIVLAKYGVVIFIKTGGRLETRLLSKLTGTYAYVQSQSCALQPPGNVIVLMRGYWTSWNELVWSY